jgi:hypothetical protein
MLMIGEYDFTDTFTWASIKDSQVFSKEGVFRNMFPIFVQVVFILVLFLVSIIIANLITGLTVNNISELYKKAGVYKLGKTVKQIISSEEFVNGRLMKQFKKCNLNFWETSLFKKLEKEGQDEGIFVCVEPNAVKTHDESIMKLIDAENYEVYTFVGQQKKTKLEMQLPSWIIRYTFEHLREKEKVQKELNASLQENIKVTQREYESVYEETDALEKNRRLAKPVISPTKSSSIMDKNQENHESSFLGGSDPFPMICEPITDDVDWELYSIGAFVDKLSNRQLTHNQKAKVMENLDDVEYKLKSLRSALAGNAKEENTSRTHL